MSSTGPKGNSSMGFSTGSAVVPATGETMLVSWLVMAFSRLDLPTLRRPNKPIAMRMPFGVRMRERPLSAKSGVAASDAMLLFSACLLCSVALPMFALSL